MPAPAAKKRITINDIAQMAGTSKTTVSFYLNGKTQRMSEETQKRIKRVIDKTGYAPSPLARGLNAKRSFLLGVIIGDITNTFSNRIVKGIGSVANAEGYRMLVCSSDYNAEEERAYIDRLLAVGVDGFIVQPSSRFKEVLRLISEANKPLVFFDSKLYDNNSNWVKTDNYEATYRAVSECVQRGYERFIMVGAQPELLSTRIERSSGFVDALDEHGITFEQLVVDAATISTEEVAEFLHEHIDGATPTLVFAPNCWALPEVYRAMSEFYPLMPEIVGLIGFDNTEWSSLASPSVTTIVQPAFEEGQQACRILLDLINGSGELDPHQVLDCTIDWGASTR